MKQLTLQPIRSVQGEIRLPGSKSMSNRVLLLAALAEGTTQVRNLLESDDTTHMLNALGALGVTVRHSDDGTYSEVGGLGRSIPGRRGDAVSRQFRHHHALAVRRNLRG